MSAVTRQGDNNTGHDDCPPVPLAGGSGNVYVNGQPCGRKGDVYIVHSCPAHIPHVGEISGGSSTVFVNGRPIARVGDSVSCGGSVAVGSDNVNAG